MAAPAGGSILSHFWAPLCAIGSHGERGPNAQICVSVFGASIVPERPRLLVVLSNTNYTTGLVAASGTMAITVLSSAQANLLEPLGLHSGRDRRKLDQVEHEITALSDPVFPGGAGQLSAKVLRDFPLGDSTAFVVAIQDRVEHGLEPLTWQAAKDVVGGDFLARWAEKSSREQEAARRAMLWH
ncbi:MAG TPA: flavin reductase [Tepidiformaceae bacterium]|nr:flavin reductase [Tepidiformaceae bacterium]HMO95570.1 flavin reductase [Tepidiformaceae bacterium]